HARPQGWLVAQRSELCAAGEPRPLRCRGALPDARLPRRALAMRGREGAMPTRRGVLWAALALAAIPGGGVLAGTPRPKDAYLYIIWPQNGARIKGAFWC